MRRALSAGEPMPGQHVLLDDDPVVVAVLAELAQHGGKVHGAAPQLAEDPLPHRLEVVPRPAARALEDARVEVLEVHVPDAGGVAAVDLERIAAAEHEMAGVEAQADERGIGSLHQLVDFPRRFDEAGAVRMEDGAKAGRVAHRTRDRARIRARTSPTLRPAGCRRE